MNPQQRPDTSVAFRFPAETSIYFFLLILSALFVSVNISQNIERSIQVMMEPDETDQGKPLLPEILGEQSASQLLLSYSRPLAVPAITVVLLFSATALLFFAYPLFILRKVRQPSIVSKTLATTKDYVSDIAADFGAKVVVVLNSTLLSANARAFGTGLKNYIKLDAGLAMIKIKAGDVFRAIVGHEIGHVINKDIPKTYIAVVIWYSVAGLFVIPLFITLGIVFLQGIFEKALPDGLDASEIRRILTVNIPFLIKPLLQLLLLLTLIIFFRNRVLRSREFYADLRSADMGNRDGLLKILNSDRTEKPGFIRRLLTFHPSSDERAKVVVNPLLLFRTDHLASFFTGVLSAVIINASFFPLMNLTLLLSLLIFPDKDSSGSIGDMLRFFLAVVIPLSVVMILALAFASLIAFSIGLQSMKQAYAAMLSGTITGKMKADALVIPLIFTFGAEAGFLLQPFYNLSPSTPVQFLIAGLTDVMVIASLSLVIAYSGYAGRALATADISMPAFGRKVRTTLALETLALSFVWLMTVAVRIYMTVQNK